MTTRAKLLTLLILVILAAGGVYLHALMLRLRSQNAPRSEESARTKLAEAALHAQDQPQQTVTLFFPSNDAGVLLQESRRLTLASSDTDRIRQIFLALLEGSEEGQSKPLPAGAELRAAFLAPDGTAYLDLAGPSLTLFDPGIESETLTVYSIVDSICVNVPAVKRVKLLVQGQEVDTLNGHADLTEAFVPDTNLNSLAP
jgi:Sporulation and spore germination